MSGISPTLLESIRKNRFVVLGRAGMDLYADPPGAETEHATAFTTALGGSSANIAVAIARQGGAASLVTSVSDDAIGRFVRNQLDAYGVENNMVRTVGGQARTSLALVETRLENCQSVIYRNSAADFEVTEADVTAVDYSAFGAFVTTGTCLAAEPSRAATFKAIDAARAANIPVILDLDYRPYSWPTVADTGEICLRAANKADILVGNDEEFATLAGDREAGKRLAAELAEQNNALVVYKMGEHGSVTHVGPRTIETGIYRVNALKPTGSGDAFLGNFISALAAGKPLEESLLRGSAAAAMVVSNVGCAPAMPNAQQLEDFMNNHPGPKQGKEAADAHTAF